MEIVFYVGLLLFVLFGPWILVWRMNRGRKQDREEDQSRWGELSRRVLALEQAVKELRGPKAPLARPEPVQREAPEEARQAPSPVAPGPNAAGPPAPESTPLMAGTPAESIRRLDKVPATPPGSTSVPARASTSSSLFAKPPLSHVTSESRQSMPNRLRSSLDLEETVGTN
jgi:hypothetical protein